MPTTITQAIDELTQFSDKENVSAIITELQKLISSIGPHDEAIELCNNKLKYLLISQKNKTSLADAAYHGLVALAEFKSINSVQITTKPPVPIPHQPVNEIGFFASANLQAVKDNLDGLLRMGFDKKNILQMVAHSGGSKNLKAVKDNLEALQSESDAGRLATPRELW